MAELTVPLAIVEAAQSLGSPFSAEELVVAAWRSKPSLFGLRGYEGSHPDSNKVLAALMGKRGLHSRGWLTRVAKRTYMLTTLGRAALANPGVRVLQSSVLSQKQIVQLLHIERGAANSLFCAGRKNELTFSVACDFWGATSTAAVKQTSEFFLELLIQLASADATMPDGRVVTFKEVKALEHLHVWLQDKFERHLKLLRTQSSTKPKL